MKKKGGGGLSFFPAKQAKREQQRKPKREVCTSSFFFLSKAGKIGGQNDVKIKNETDSNGHKVTAGYCATSSLFFLQER